MDPDTWLLKYLISKKNEDLVVGGMKCWYSLWDSSLFTLPETSTWRWMLGRLVSFLGWFPDRCEQLVSGRGKLISVNHTNLQDRQNCVLLKKAWERFLHSLENSIFDREEFRVHYPLSGFPRSFFSVWGDFCWLILRWEVCKKPSTYPPSFTTVISAGNPISSITPLRKIRGKNSTRTFSSCQSVIAFHWFWFPNRTVPKKSYRSSLILSFSRCFFWWVERPLFGSSIYW